MVQAEVLRFADSFTGHTSVGVNEYMRTIDTPEARLQGLQWKLALDAAALAIATGPSPLASVLDLVTLASLARVTLERRAADPESGSAFDSWRNESRTAEANAWKMAAGILTAEQQNEFRGVLDQWLADNATTSMAFFRRPQELATGVRESREKASKGGSVFKLVGLDPMAGLDPAVREAARARLFAERALYTSQRLPILLRWQLELLSERFLSHEQITNALTGIEHLSLATEAASQTAVELAHQFTAEREAIIDAFAAQEGQLRELSAEVAQTLGAGEKMSTSLNATIVTFDKLMDRFGVGPDKEEDPGRRRFDILDYARTAEQIAATAQQLNVLIHDTSATLDAPGLDQRITSLNAVAAQVRADAKSVLNHAFALATGLVLLIFACAALYRRTDRRWIPTT
jgi:uncharacterized coiled-coil protein SlyX